MTLIKGSLPLTYKHTHTLAQNTHAPLSPFNQVPNGCMSGTAVLLWHTTYTAHHIRSRITPVPRNLWTTMTHRCHVCFTKCWRTLLGILCCQVTFARRAHLQYCPALRGHEVKWVLLQYTHKYRDKSIWLLIRNRDLPLDHLPQGACLLQALDWLPYDNLIIFTAYTFNSPYQETLIPLSQCDWENIHWDSETETAKGILVRIHSKILTCDFPPSSKTWQYTLIYRPLD